MIPILRVLCPSFSLWLLLAAPAFLPAGARAEQADMDLIIKVANIAPVPLGQMVEDLKSARVVFIGEQHSDRSHHVAQLKIIRELVAQGAKVSVGLEMMRSGDQEVLDDWVAGRLRGLELFGAYSKSWGVEQWNLYADFFYFAKSQKIPLVGLNIPREIVQQVAAEGFASLEEEVKSGLPEIRCEGDDKYLQLISVIAGSRDTHSPFFRNFCEAQMLWDTAMAVNVVRYLKENPDSLLVVLAGSFHAWKHGIPAQVGQRAKVDMKVVLPSSDTSFLQYDILLEDADYVWWQGEQGK